MKQLVCQPVSDRGDVIIIATGRYYSSFVSAGTTESDDHEDDHEIEVAGCGQVALFPIR